MDDETLLDLLSTTSPTQFLIGVFVLVFGTRKILSTDNVEKSLGGLFIPVKWLHKKRQDAADEQVEAVAKLKKQNKQSAAELDRYHSWSVLATKRIRDLESVIAANDIEVPPPPFIYLHEYRGDEEDSEEDEE